MKKILVSYFSATGVTKKVAENISTALKSDLFEIEPVDKYTENDLDWNDKKSRSTVEMVDKESRPKIKDQVPNFDNYDIVIIGFPVWWYTAPRIINTFIEENDLTAKKIYIFVTSGGSGYEESFNDLKSTYTNLNFISGTRFTNNLSKEEIKNFVNSCAN